MALDPELQREINALEAAATHADGRHSFLADFQWPEGTRIAVNFTCDFDAMLLRRLKNEPVGQRAQGEFGGRVGIWRLIELFDAHAVKATIFTPGRICELYPRAVKAAHDSGHEIADHMWEHQVPKDPALERDHVTRSTEALTEIVGRRPTGSRSRHSVELLLDHGYLYASHGSSAHLPYYLRDAPGGRPILNLPFHYAIDDAMFFSFAWQGSDYPAQRLSEPGRVLDMWWDAFEQQYRAGGYLNICLHPFVSGRALRIAMLDRLIARMKEYPGVWFCTCEAVARYCVEAFPAETAGPADTRLTTAQ